MAAMSRTANTSGLFHRVLYRHIAGDGRQPVRSVGPRSRRVT
jgi:hypothetical protein